MGAPFSNLVVFILWCVLLFGSISLIFDGLESGNVLKLCLGILFVILIALGALWLVAVLLHGTRIDNSEQVGLSDDRIYAGEKNEQAQAELADQRLRAMFQDHDDHDH